MQFYLMRNSHRLNHFREQKFRLQVREAFDAVGAPVLKLVAIDNLLHVFASVLHHDMKNLKKKLDEVERQKTLMQLTITVGI